jgi:hypothetical protein
VLKAATHATTTGADGAVAVVAAVNTAVHGLDIGPQPPDQHGSGLAHAVPGSCRWRPRPSVPPHQAYFAGQPPVHPGVAQSPPPKDPWNHQALLATMNAANSMASAPRPSEWYLDTGASSHMASNSRNLSRPTPVYNSLPITVGNDATLPVTHRASSSIPTTKIPLLLNNVLVSPSLVKNLISVRSLTHDNNVLVEFDPFGFSVKDLPTNSVILCWANFIV